MDGYRIIPQGVRDDGGEVEALVVVGKNAAAESCGEERHTLSCFGHSQLFCSKFVLSTVLPISQAVPLVYTF